MYGFRLDTYVPDMSGREIDTLSSWGRGDTPPPAVTPPAVSLAADGGALPGRDTVSKSGLVPAAQYCRGKNMVVNVTSGHRHYCERPLVRMQTLCITLISRLCPTPAQCRAPDVNHGCSSIHDYTCKCSSCECTTLATPRLYHGHHLH